MSHTQMYHSLLESIAFYSGKMLEMLEPGAGDLPQWTNDIISRTRAWMKDVTHFLRGQDSRGIRYGSDSHGRAYMATKNLREINDYALESLSYLRDDAGILPPWVESKIAVCAEYMDLVGHFIENEIREGRVYGSYLNPVPGDAGDEAFYRGIADGIINDHRNPYSPNSFKRSVYEQGFQKGLGGRLYGARDGDSERRPSGSRRGGADESQGGAIDSGKHSNAAFRGEKGHRVVQSHRRRQHHPYEVHVSPSPSPDQMANAQPSKMNVFMPRTRMLEANRMTLAQRMLGQDTGRRFGVPGFVPGEPGWAGNAGVAQSPHPTRRVRRSPSQGQGFARPGVQTYGSLGYGSMGDGSMDMAVRGARFSSTAPMSEKTFKTKSKKRFKK